MAVDTHASPVSSPSVAAQADFASGIRWWRVLGAGLLIEVLLMVVAVPFFATGRAELLSIVIVPATLIVAIPCGAWASRGAAAPLLNGALAGVAAIALYVLIAIAG